MGEVLTNLVDGSSAIFRYIKSENKWTNLHITSSGKGIIRIFMNGQKAGEVDITGSGAINSSYEVQLSCEAGEYELELQSADSDTLRVAEIIL